jgi:uncharacterized protein YbbC (DUF1343 family)
LAVALACLSLSASATAQQATTAEHSGARPLGTRCGIDVLQRDGYGLLQGKRVGLITNHTGIAGDGTPTYKLLYDAPEVNLVKLFSPEHGIAGKLDVPEIKDSQDPTTGLVIVSLYGKSRKPTAESLRGIDMLVFDIQDIGTRFYTYISTMGYAMQAAAEQDISFVVLDRPNPINGVTVNGPLLDEGKQSFVGFHTIPVRHGMTVGELARLFRHELNLELELHVVAVEGWRRADYFDRTGLLWVNPSPNMRCLNQALLYPGVGLLETTNLSVGRGTDTPFEVIGAPWIDPRRFAAALNRADTPGVRFVPLYFRPSTSKFAGERCGGVAMVVVNRDACRPLAVGLQVARQLRQLYPDQWETQDYDRLLGNQATLNAVLAAEPFRAIEALWQTDLDRFRTRRSRFLLYQ